MPEKDRTERERADREREEEASGFKVTDRRLFTPEGERREEAAPTPAPESAPPPPQAKPPAAEQPSASRAESHLDSGPAAPGEGTRPQRPGPVSFEHLVMSLATTAMYQLGLVKSHEDENPPIDLPSAKETITLLEILQTKTKGNLTEEEQGLLEGSLYELHMVFVEMTKTGRGR